MSKILSTPSKSTTATGGIPAVMRIVDSITIPVPGAEGHQWMQQEQLM